MIFRLRSNDTIFPDPALAEPNGLLAVGGDLSTSRLIAAYNNAIFPWFSEGEPICWFSPHERCVIFPAKIRISGSMKKLLRKKKFRITMDTAFTQVIAACKNIPRRDEHGTWITDEMENAYINLHKAGIAHSIEAWDGDELAGGIYGLRINEIFCGESMFSKRPNASKAAMIWLCQSGMYSLIDCQVPNDHLMSLGAEMISQCGFLDMLRS